MKHLVNVFVPSYAGKYGKREAFKARIEISVDVEGLAIELGRKAAQRPSRKATLGRGKIVVKLIGHRPALTAKP